MSDPLKFGASSVLVKTDGSSTPYGLMSENYSDTAHLGARLYLRRAQNISTSPDPVGVDKSLGAICFGGYNGFNFGQAAGGANIAAWTTEAWAAVQEVSAIQFAAMNTGVTFNTGGSAHYFTIDTIADGNYYFWINVTDGTTSDPGAAGTPIQVDVTLADTALVIANAIAAAADTTGYFSSSATVMGLVTVTFTHLTPGNAADISSLPASFGMWIARPTFTGGSDAQGCQLRFLTTPNGTATSKRRMTIDHDGSLLLHGVDDQTGSVVETYYHELTLASGLNPGTLTELSFPIIDFESQTIEFFMKETSGSVGTASGTIYMTADNNNTSNTNIALEVSNNGLVVPFTMAVTFAGVVELYYDTSLIANNVTMRAVVTKFRRIAV